MVRTFLHRCFYTHEDKLGIIQIPNLPLLGWIISRVVSYIFSATAVTGLPRQGVLALGNSLLFTWAYLELTAGVSYFRKALGFIVLAVLITTYFF